MKSIVFLYLFLINDNNISFKEHFFKKRNPYTYLNKQKSGNKQVILFI